MSKPHWVCPRFPCLHCLGSRLLCWELSEAGSGLYAPPRSKPLRFRYSGTPQRCWLCWACILCPSQVRAAQVTRCLVSGVAWLIASSVPAAWFSGCIAGTPWISTVQNPGKSWLATKPTCSLVDDVSLGPRLPPSGSGCPCLPVSGGGWTGLQLANSAQSFVLWAGLAVS